MESNPPFERKIMHFEYDPVAFIYKERIDGFLAAAQKNCIVHLTVAQPFLIAVCVAHSRWQNGGSHDGT